MEICLPETANPGPGAYFGKKCHLSYGGACVLREGGDFRPEDPRWSCSPQELRVLKSLHALRLSVSNCKPREDGLDP